ncbi:Isoflavone reductase like [Apostasia shenzhenica]|uniref:Isoflavone reductase like n=1 Tax=Apostasia shenzhenica TaxID=1088818 RepID=A0A2I0BF20_9ASPA|nr:Isoflavone reductase like [Apostasia shenzhenica]
MGHALVPGRVSFDEKMEVRKAIEVAGIPFTYVSGNCFMGYFVAGLCQLGTVVPSKHSVCFHGDGNVKCQLSLSLSLSKGSIGSNFFF